MTVISFYLARQIFAGYPMQPGSHPGQLSFWAWPLLASFLILFGGIATAALVVATVPRLLNRFITPEKTYPLFGVHYVLQRTLARLTNAGSLLMLFGDSSAAVYYLALLGYRQPGRVQTGSNTGVDLKQDNPHLITLGSGTMISDALSIVNADYSNTAFRVSPVSIGANSFFGNGVVYPSGARVGDNCLFGTKTMVPIEGPLRENVGLLGSPPFEIPRTVNRDADLDGFRTEDELRYRLPAKNRHNAVTVALFLLMRWANLFVGMVAGWAAFRFFAPNDTLAVLVWGASVLVFSIALSVFGEWAAVGFKRLTPRFCSIYERAFWRHERYWKLMSGAAGMFNGTPFKSVLYRLMGARVGKRVFDDGCGIPERSIVTIGDDCTLNSGTVIQAHSMEDGAFKLDAITIGSGVTIGVGGFVHYGTIIHDGAIVEADSFLMKGEEVPANSIFGGNPARELARPTKPPAPSKPPASKPPAASKPSAASEPPQAGKTPANRTLASAAPAGPTS
jgi:non-ribosomal peptide synthetase-like protein